MKKINTTLLLGALLGFCACHFESFDERHGDERPSLRIPQGPLAQKRSQLRGFEVLQRKRYQLFLLLLFQGIGKSALSGTIYPGRL